MSDDRRPTNPSELSRRDALKVLGAAAALSGGRSDPAATEASQSAAQVSPKILARRTPSDPDLIHPKIWWTKLLTPGELATLAVLCDTIIPADDRSPSASRLGAPDYINEWVSAPSEDHRRALVQVQGGIAWLDAESGRRFSRPFTGLEERERHEICDDICYLAKAKPEHRAAARFFDLIRDLTATAFYTTKEGMKDLGYVGNVPLAKFDPPPADLLRRLGLEQGGQG
jgi:gluconate 2-dehydrogenase subunit 3-like protein